jgi:hypothetical protein
MSFPITGDLMGLGLPAALAQKLGFNVSAKAGVGTAQSGATALVPADLVRATTAVGQTAFVLNGFAPGDVAILENTTAAAALVFPPSGGTINTASANASVSVAQNVARIFVCVAAGRFVSFLAA